MTAGLAELLDALGRDPDERIAICHGASFTAELTTVEKAPDLAERHADTDVWFSTQPLHTRVNGTGRGTAADVIGLRELYADLDVKAGGMPGWDAAAAVITDLAELLSVAPVAVVSTGHGLQPHWSIERGDGTDWPDDTDPRWSAAGALLRRWGRLVNRAAEIRGGQVDNVYDLARVLRAPGTTNRKAAPKRTWLTALAGTPVSLDRIRECLTAYGVRELSEDSEQLGETVAAAGSWQWAERTCTYVSLMCGGWPTDTPPNGRHPWLVGQATRLAAAHRHGCITEQDHTAGAAVLAARFRVLLAGGDTRKETPREVADALQWGVTRVERMTDTKVARELGDHPHPPDASTIGDEAAADPFAAAVDLADLDKQTFPPATYLVDKILPRGGITLLAGPPKIGKSYLALGVGLAVRQRTTALGRLTTDATGEVLFISLDDQNPARAQQRARQINRGQPLPRGFLLHTAPNLGRGERARDAIRRYLEQHPQTRLIIIDTLTHLRGDRRSTESVYDADVRFMATLRTLLDGDRYTILCLTHVRKEGADDGVMATSGTYGVTGGADSLIVLTGNRHAAGRAIEVVSRDDEGCELALTFTEHGLIVTDEDPHDPALFLVPDDARVYRALREFGEGGGTAIELTGALGGGTRIGDRLARMARHGVIRRLGRGRYAAD